MLYQERPRPQGGDQWLLVGLLCHTGWEQENLLEILASAHAVSSNGFNQSIETISQLRSGLASTMRNGWGKVNRAPQFDGDRRICSAAKPADIAESEVLPGQVDPEQPYQYLHAWER